MDSNCWVGVGRLTKDAEFSVTKKGTPMSKFRMAVNDRRNDKTLFINVLCFGKMAENLQPRLVKGRPVSIQGKLNIDDYEDENQNKRSSVISSINGARMPDSFMEDGRDSPTVS